MMRYNDEVIEGVRLLHYAKLHRFLNEKGELTSAIVCFGIEVDRCPRHQEQEMIKLWNEQER